MIGITPDQTKRVNEIKIAVNNNLAAASIKEGKYKRVVDCTNKVIEIDSNNTKALFRRGKAYLEQGDLDKAERDLSKASQLDPNDGAIKKELQILKQKTKVAEKKTQKFYANMFDKMSKDEEKEPEKNEEKQNKESNTTENS